jgi:hypothetical protein
MPSPRPDRLPPTQKPAASNRHYIDLQNKLINPANPADNTAASKTSHIHLRQYQMRKTQPTVTGIADTAGLLTTRAAGLAYFSAGTNRRELRFAFTNFLCMDIAQTERHHSRRFPRAPGCGSHARGVTAPPTSKPAWAAMPKWTPWADLHSLQFHE